MTFYWRIIAIDDYIEQVGNLPIGIQSNIGKKWMDVATHENPQDVGSTATCPQGRPYVLVIFPGLAFEFLYKIEDDEKIIRLINCNRLEFLDYGQTGQL